MTYRTQLQNGVRIIGEEIPSVRSVSIGVWINTGSRYETEQNNGISHFIEHMLFKGTDRYSAKELAGLFDGLGGQVNAFTSKEYTCYYAKVLDEHFDTAVDTLSDMLFHSKYSAKEMEKEKKVIIEEIRMYEDTPDELVMDILSESVFPKHPLGYTILGPEENIARFTGQDVFDYLHTRYHGSNIVVAVAGNVSEEKVVATMERLFGHASPAPGGERTLVPPSFHQSNSVRVKDIEQVHVSLASPGLVIGDHKMYAMILLNNALGNSPSSRLFQAIREDRGMAYSVFSFHSAYRDSGMFGIYTGTSPEYVKDVLGLVQSICVDVAEHGITDEELRKGKEQCKGSMMLSLESTSSRMSRLAKNELLLGREITLDESLREIMAVTHEDVRNLAQEILSQPFAVAAVGQVDEGEVMEWLGT